jgi:hypothetical protein
MHIKCYYFQKRKSLFKNDSFWSKLKNIPKGVRSTKCPGATWRKKTTKYKLYTFETICFAHISC